MKDKLKNYGVWVSLISALLLFLSSISDTLGLHIDIPIVEEILYGICAVLVALGIISNPNDGKGYLDTSKSNSEKDTTNQD